MIRRRRTASLSAVTLAEFIRKIIEKQISDNFDINKDVNEKKKLLIGAMRDEGYDEDVEEILYEQFETYTNKLEDFLYYAEKLEENLARIKRLH